MSEQTQTKEEVKLTLAQYQDLIDQCRRLEWNRNYIVKINNDDEEPGYIYLLFDELNESHDSDEYCMREEYDGITIPVALIGCGIKKWMKRYKFYLKIDDSIDYLNKEGKKITGTINKLESEIMSLKESNKNGNLTIEKIIKTTQIELDRHLKELEDNSERLHKRMEEKTTLTALFAPFLEKN